MFVAALFFGNLVLSSGQTITKEHPTLPTMWKAQTIEPGAGKGYESYMFNPNPTPEYPSALWSNYTGCQRLIYIPHTYDATRYLLKCNAVDCCHEEQDGNQVEFQIPNVYYPNPAKQTDVYYQRKNITNFGEVVEADEWSWSFGYQHDAQKWRAYTRKCSGCVNGVELLQWSSSAAGSTWYTIQFRGYIGIDPASEEGKAFAATFAVPSVCQANNLLHC
jgi:hypothetical protein